MFKQSILELKKTQTIAILSILIAMNVLISSVYIPVAPGLRIYATFFVIAIAGVVGGPATAIFYGFICDILGVIIHPSGPFFIGYTITTMLSSMIYALFLYKQKITIAKLLMAKLLVNLLCNVTLNSIWNYILFDKAFIYFVSKSIIKNIVLLPIEVFLLYVLFKLLLNTLNRLKYTNQKDIPFF
jgi:ECF transporter S component (folate family)